jgi:protein O-GlcNAc transferase
MPSKERIPADAVLAAGHLARGDLASAERLCRRALLQDPNDVGALEVLGYVARNLGRLDDSVALLKRCAGLRPGVPEYHNALGVTFLHGGREAEAAESLREAIRLRPDYPEGHANLALALTRLGDLAGATGAAARAIGLRPGYEAAHVAHAGALRTQGRLDEAIASIEELLGVRRTAQSMGRLASLLTSAGRVEEAVARYREAIALDPSDSDLHSNLLYTLHYLDGVTGEQLLAEHLMWARRHAEPLYPKVRSNNVDRTPGRRLRIGYVSADFRQHSVATFLEALVTGHDRAQFEVYCYSDVRRPDEVTKRFRAAADVWRQTRGATDAQVADLIRLDQIDVLVDPAGHMGPNRPLLFARKPAPLQIAFPGYPGTGGLPTMDYFVTDVHQDPPGITEHHYVERPMRLRVCRSYRPPADCPEPGAPPVLRNGYVTFGSVNRVEKITPRMMRRWAEILGRVQQSRLIVLSGHGDNVQAERQFRQHFATNGLGGHRVTFLGRAQQREYFRLFDQIDLLLDTEPYNGCTTTYDGLWMGVPIIVEEGSRYSARIGTSILASAGESQAPFRNHVCYVKSAIALAGSAMEIRGASRPRSRLCGMNHFVMQRELEHACRSAWENVVQAD